jgi:hypothetical protein
VGGIMAHGTLLIKVETVESVGLTFSFEGRTRVLLLPVLSSTFVYSQDVSHSKIMAAKCTSRRQDGRWL